MIDLNIQSFKSVSESAKARMQKEREQDNLPICMGFHNAIKTEFIHNPSEWMIIKTNPLDAQ